MRLAPFVAAVVSGDSCTLGVTNPIVVGALTPPEITWCSLLVEHVPLPPPPSRACQDLWDQLVGREWLVEPTTADLHVRIFGAGSTGTALGVALAQAGVTTVSFEDYRARHHADSWAYAATVPANVGATHAAAWTVRDATPTVRVAGSERPAQVHVITTQGHSALGTVLDCMAQETPHLIISGMDDAVRVGPWVVPGQTPCWWCWGGQADPGPASDRLQALAAARNPICPPWQGWTVAGLATRIVTRWRDQRESPGHTLIVTADGRLRRVLSNPQPGCGCGYVNDPPGALATISRI